MTRRWRDWWPAAAIIVIATILAVVAVPCENLRILVKNDSLGAATIRITVRQFFATPARIVWTGTAKAGETREIALNVGPGDYDLVAAARFSDHRELRVKEEVEDSGNPVFGTRTYDLRLRGESLRSEDDAPRTRFERKPNYLLAPMVIVDMLCGILKCQDEKLRRDFRRWIVGSPFRSNFEGGSG